MEIMERLICDRTFQKKELYTLYVILIILVQLISLSENVSTSTGPSEAGTVADQTAPTAEMATVTEDGLSSGDISSGDIEVTAFTAASTEKEAVASTTTTTTTEEPTTTSTTVKPSTTPIPEDGFFKQQMIVGMAGGFGCFVGLVIAIVLVWNCVCSKVCGDPSQKGNGRKIMPMDFRNPANASQSSSRRKLSMSTDGAGS